MCKELRPALYTIQGGKIHKQFFDDGSEPSHDALAERYDETCHGIMVESNQLETLNELAEIVNTVDDGVFETVYSGVLYLQPKNNVIDIYGTCLFIGAAMGAAVAKGLTFSD